MRAYDVFTVTRILKKEGFSLAEINSALRMAKESDTTIGGWGLRYYESEEKYCCLHPSFGGIYIDDYPTRICFCKELLYTLAGKGYRAKHRELHKVLEFISEKEKGPILCEWDTNQFAMRQNQVQRLGYSVIKTNREVSNSSECYVVIKKESI